MVLYVQSHLPNEARQKAHLEAHFLLDAGYVMTGSMIMLAWGLIVNSKEPFHHSRLISLNLELFPFALRYRKKKVGP